MSKLIHGKQPTHCGLGNAHPKPRGQGWTSTKERSKVLCRLCLIYRSQFHILIPSLCLFLSIYFPVSSLTPVPKASKIFKHPLKENCMVSATGMHYPFTVAIRSSLPGPQMENPSWAEDPCREGAGCFLDANPQPIPCTQMTP